MKKLIMMCGTKQSGKTTGAQFIMGYYLVQKGIIPNYHVSEQGESYFTHGDKKFDFLIESTDTHFKNWLRDVVYPHVKNVAFADCLKTVSADLFGLDYQLLYGTNKQKEQKTHIKLSALEKFLEKNKFKKLSKDDPNRTVTHREFLEIFGTDVARHIDGNCHIRSALTSLNKHECEIGIIADCRFPNELDYITSLKDTYDVHIIKCGRRLFKSDSTAENALDNIEDKKFDLIIPEDKTIQQKNNLILKYLVDKEVLQKTKMKVKNAS